MANLKFKKWQLTVAASIIKNVVQYYKDYGREDCVLDVAQEIVDAMPKKRRAK